MRITNLLSVIGLLFASYFAYGHFYLGVAGPCYYPYFTTLLILLVFFISYILSLFDAKASIARIFALSIIFAGFVVTTIYSILVMLGKCTYPIAFGIPGAYIEAVIFLFLMIQWNRHK